MPVLDSHYKTPYFFRNGHISTAFSGLIRTVNGVLQTRERITLPDGDFLDLDWSSSPEKTDKVIIMLHGLEGDAKDPICWEQQNYLMIIFLMQYVLILEGVAVMII
jgi:predicted alpha/beta-fold hydrolase